LAAGSESLSAETAVLKVDLLLRAKGDHESSSYI